MLFMMGGGGGSQIEPPVKRSTHRVHCSAKGAYSIFILLQASVHFQSNHTDLCGIKVFYITFKYNVIVTHTFELLYFVVAHLNSKRNIISI